MGTPSTLITRPIRCGPAASARMVWPTGMIMPPPMPCSTRKAISALADHAAPARAEPVRKMTREMIHTRLAPKRSTAQPLRGMTMDRASR